MQNVYGDAYPTYLPSKAKEAYGGFFQPAGYNQTYNVSAVTDPEGNSSAYNAAMFMEHQPVFYLVYDQQQNLCRRR